MRFSAEPDKVNGAEITAALEDAGYERVVLTYYPHTEELDVQAQPDDEGIAEVVNKCLGTPEQAGEEEEPLFFEGVHLEDPDSLADDLNYEDVEITQTDEGLYLFARYSSGTVVDERSRDAIQKRIDKKA